ncbi:VOC family protein [Pseudobacteroides cellulosolvens]|uniref:Glyoxalase-like domain containing protein n=1 Tax=Pseudobacteroides cellulosolvens ATCC 35603 = DSM 2933 TaxID=398512 RepID=A0A0L6JVI7_9FIRM|nr:VOC family protein [Pseudobacteroides cellulosolvens]KNY29447.1 Glyoxalase-like domain containing protein [Pseudobacteroides cellulosolvens ATCC 35603 = DSM 2933]
MKFCWCTLTVKNMEDSLRFYQEIVGLPINKRFTAGSETEICFLGDGETKVELICNAKNEVLNECNSITLGFEVDSVDNMMEFIKEKGLKIDSGPFQPNPTIKFFYVRDPNNIKIQFVQSM